MAYDKERLFEKALKAIEKDVDLVFIENVAGALGISKQTLYKHFPADSDKMDAIKDALSKNKAELKKHLRGNWKKADSSATVQIALYKLLGTKEELSILSNTPQRLEQDDVPLIQIENYIPFTHEH